MAVDAKLDKSEYFPGDVMTLTVTTAPGDRNRNTPINVVVHIDETGLNLGSGVLQDVTVSATVVKAPAPIVVTDSARTWKPVSDNGTVAVFTSTAA